MIHILLLLLLALPFSAEAVLRVAVGSYAVSGSPADDRDITVTPSFAIKVVFVKCAGATHGLWRHQDGGGSNTQYYGTAAAQVSNRIQSLGTGTFQVGTGSEVQPASTTCYYAAFGGDATEIDFGNYTGNGLDDQQITSLSFQPGMVLVKAITTAGIAVWRATVITGDQTLNLATGTLTANQIQAILSNGWERGTDATVNTDTVTYKWFAIKDIANQAGSGSFVGTGGDDLGVTMFADPLFAWMKRSIATNGCGRWGTTGDLSWLMGATAEAANRIQAFTNTGATVGTDSCANSSGSTAYWWAARDQVTSTRNRLRRITLE